MQNTSNRNLSLVSVVQAAKDLSLSLTSFFDLASKLQCSFLVHIPDNTAVYLRIALRIRLDDDPGSLEADIGVQRGLLERIRHEIEFFCLAPPEWSPVLRREQFPKREFGAVALLNEDGSVAHMDPSSYTSRYMDQLPGFNSLESFRTYEPAEGSLDRPGRHMLPAHEKSVAIRLEDLLISARELDRISENAGNEKPKHDKFLKGDWTSTMLAQLNEASTLFFSTGKDASKAEIENWLREKWESRRVGKDVIEQAANAILPDFRYKYGPAGDHIPERVRGAHNSYASSALIIVSGQLK